MEDAISGANLSLFISNIYDLGAVWWMKEKANVRTTLEPDDSTVEPESI